MSFFKKDKSRIFSVIMAVAIVVLVVAVLSIFSKQESAKAESDRLNTILEICTKQPERDADRHDREFYEKETASLAKRYSIGREDRLLVNLSANKAAVIPSKYSFYEISDWAGYYLGLDSIKPRTQYSTPEELKEYLSAALEKEHPAEKIYLQLDPVELEQQYFSSHRFDEDTDSLPTFLQIMNECLWNYISVYSTTDFRIYLPMVSLQKWASYTDEELAEIKDKYEQFVFYTSRFSNKELVWAVDREWIVANPSAYGVLSELKTDALQRIFLLNESSDKFNFTYNEFEDIWAQLIKYIDNYKNGAYEVFDLSGTEIVLVGENLFAGCTVELFSVAETIKAFTGATVYNVSESSDYANALASKADEIVKLGLNSKNPVFVINYGLSDYLSGAGLGNLDNINDTETFLGALSLGITTLKKQFPDARIILVSPYRINDFKNGTKAVADGSLSLQEIAWSEDTIALNEGIEYINLFETLGLGSNPEDFYTDKFFLDDAGRYLVGKTIADYLGNN